MSQSVGNRSLPVYRGSRPAVGRRPKATDQRRRCADDSCGTVLSRYNLGEYCRVHAPLRFPRVRGQLTTS
jgi:hypothetical protein